MNTLHHYQQAFGKLNRGNAQGTKEKAPHKPILLLAVMDEIEAGSIVGNRIYITDELIAAFRENWSRYVVNIRFKPDFYLPFYHLSGDRFWHLMMQSGRDSLLTSSHSPKSLRSLRASVLYAWLDEPLYLLLQDAASRQALRDTLLNACFNKIPGRAASYIHEVEQQMLHEAPVAYQRRTETFSEEELAGRSGVFKRLIPRIYNYTCCISGTRILAGPSVQMVDACHIVPFAESRDDTIANGLCLCPNLHRAFDRGLVGIDASYQVVVADGMVESAEGYRLRDLAGRQILLPEREEYWPGRGNLERHWGRWEKVNFE